MATTESDAGAPPALPEEEPDRGVMLPVRVRDGREHYYRRVDGETVSPAKYVDAPRPYKDARRAYLVEVHRVVENGEEQWTLVYADADGRPVALELLDPLVYGDVGIRHAVAAPEAALRAGEEAVGDAECDRLCELVLDHHWINHEVHCR